MIKERFSEIIIEYKVIFVNSNSYCTNSLEEVIRENNGTSDNIINIVISATQDEVLSIVIDFEKRVDSFLSVTGSNRDSTFLLFNDLKTYIDKEIAIAKRLNVTYRHISFILLIPLLLGTLIPRVASKNLSQILPKVV